MDGLFGLLVTIFLKVSVVSCEARYCSTYDGTKWCSHGCCDDGTRIWDGSTFKIYECCEGDTVWMPFTYGGVGFVGLCMFIAFFCWYKQFMDRRHSRGHGVAVQPAPVTVQVKTSTQPSPAPVQPAPFPAANFNNQVVTNYGMQPSAPPPPPAYPGHAAHPYSTDPVYPPPPSNFRRF